MTSPRSRIGGRAALVATALVALTLVFVPGVADAGTGPNAVCTPAGVDDFYFMSQGATLEVTTVGEGVLGNDTTCFSGSGVVTTTSNGDLSVGPDGTFTYEPDPSFSGSDSFVYEFTVEAVPAVEAQNNIGQVYTATATIRVECVPDLVDDAYAGLQDTPIVVAAPGVVANDNLCLFYDSVEVVTPPTSGTLNFEPTGGFTYTPNPGFVGVDTYTYRAFFDDDKAAPEEVNEDPTPP